MSIELIYEQGCPGLQATRHAVLEALTKLNMEAEWTEWEISDPGLPAHAEGFGSPTVLVEGRDVAGEPPENEKARCRLYRGLSGQSNAPSSDIICQALREKILKPLAQDSSKPKF